MLQEARRNSWRRYVGGVNSRTPLDMVWKKIKKISGKFSPSTLPVLHTGGDFVSDPVAVGSVMAEYFASVSSRDPSKPYAGLCR